MRRIREFTYDQGHGKKTFYVIQVYDWEIFEWRDIEISSKREDGKIAIEHILWSLERNPQEYIYNEFVRKRIMSDKVSVMVVFNMLPQLLKEYRARMKEEDDAEKIRAPKAKTIAFKIF